MNDIGVYTKKEILKEKVRYARDEMYDVWWRLKDIPDDLQVDRIFFACAGYWRGYFEVSLIVDNKLHLVSYTELDEKIKVQKFRGYTEDVPDLNEKYLTYSYALVESSVKGIEYVMKNESIDREMRKNFESLLKRGKNRLEKLDKYKEL